MTKTTSHQFKLKATLFIIVDIICIIIVFKTFHASLYDFGRYQECMGSRNLQVYQDNFLQTYASQSAQIHDESFLKQLWQLDI